MHELRDTHLPASNCLNCGEEMDAAMSAQGNYSPNPGSIAICIKCSHIMAFDANLLLRELSDEEMKAVAGDADVLRAIKAISQFRKPT